MKLIYVPLALAATMSLHAQVGPSAASCLAGNCFGFGPPSGPATLNLPIYLDISQNPAAQYVAQGNAQGKYSWVLLPSGSGGVVYNVYGYHGPLTIAVPTNVNQLSGATSGGSTSPATATSLGTVQLGPAGTSAILSNVATSGSYNDLNTKPTIPTNNNQLANGAGYITAGQAPVTSVNGMTGAVTVSGGGSSSPATATSLGTVQLATGQTATTLAKVATTGAYGDVSGTPTKVSQLANDAGYVTSASAGAPSQGAAYVPQLSAGNGQFLADQYTTYAANGNRDYYAYNGAANTYHSVGLTTAPNAWSLQAMSEFAGPTWNQGQFNNSAGTNQFFTHNATGISIISANHASGISGSLDISAQHYQHNGDNHTIYVYSNFMPGTTLGGADEGHADFRLSSNPSSTPTGTLAGDSTTTAVGSTQLRFATLACGGSSGSAFGSGSCLGAGGWLADVAQAIYVGPGSGAGVSTTGLHMSAVTLVGSSPVIAATVTETFPASDIDVMAVSSAQIDTPAGAAVTITYSGATGTAPSSGMGCLSSAVENISESMTYTTSGSNITMTGLQFQHEGGDVHINLSRPCRPAGFIVEGNDNATGKTFYAVLGHPDAHTVWLTTSQGGARFAGTTTIGGSIKPDGGTYGQFQEFPGAIVYDVTDPTYSATGQYYLYTPKYVHVGINNVAWKANEGIELGYHPSDTYFMERFFCANPLQDMNKGSACHSTTFSGSVGVMNEYVLANNTGVSLRRGLPDMNRIKLFGTNSGMYGNVYAGAAPRTGYFNFSAGCDNTQNPANCPDAPLLSEPGLVNGIMLNRAAHGITFNAPGGYTFNGGNITGAGLALSGNINAATGFFSTSFTSPSISSSVIVGAGQTNSCVITNSCPINFFSNLGGTRPQAMSMGGDYNGNFVQWLQNPADHTLMLGTAGQGFQYRVCVNNCIINSGYAGAAVGGETMLLDKYGNVAFNSASVVIDASGNTKARKLTATAASGGFNAPLYTPSSSASACSAGDFADDANYHYVCVATNMWKRVALSSF